MKQRGKIHCDFCGKSQDDLKEMVDEGRVAICVGCIEVCAGAIVQHRTKAQAAERIVTLEARVAALEALNGKGIEK